MRCNHGPPLWAWTVPIRWPTPRRGEPRDVCHSPHRFTSRGRAPATRAQPIIDSAQDCRPQPDRQQQDHDKRCSYIQRKGGRARRSVGSGRTPGGALTAAGLAFCGKRESAPLPENRFCRSVTNRRTLKQLFFHTANPRYRGIATERRALRGKQMKRLGGGRVRFLRRSSARPNPRQALHQGLLYKWAPQRGIQINSERHIPETKIFSVRKHLQHIFIHLQNSL